MARIKNHLGRNLSSQRTDDKLSKAARSTLMAKIKSRGTSFEHLFFEALKNEGIVFEAHPKDIFGHPDMIINDKVCVFLDSNFWHGWQYPRWKHKLKDDFWRMKIEKNRKRDRKTTYVLRKKGYLVLRLWEHQIKSNIVKCIERIRQLINVQRTA